MLVIWPRLCLYTDGHLIMGCSDLTGRNWSGSLWYYRDPVEPPNVEKALTGIELDQSVVDGRLVANNRVSQASQNRFHLPFTREWPDFSDAGRTGQWRCGTGDPDL